MTQHSHLYLSHKPWQDHYDVKMPAHLLLVKLANSEPSTVLAALERLVAPLEKTLTAKVKSDAVKQEVGMGKGVGFPDTLCGFVTQWRVMSHGVGVFDAVWGH